MNQERRRSILEAAAEAVGIPANRANEFLQFDVDGIPVMRPLERPQIRPEFRDRPLLINEDQQNAQNPGL